MSQWLLNWTNYISLNNWMLKAEVNSGWDQQMTQGHCLSFAKLSMNNKVGFPVILNITSFRIWLQGLRRQVFFVVFAMLYCMLFVQLTEKRSFALWPWSFVGCCSWIFLFYQSINMSLHVCIHVFVFGCAGDVQFREVDSRWMAPSAGPVAASYPKHQVNKPPVFIPVCMTKCLYCKQTTVVFGFRMCVI